MGSWLDRISESQHMNDFPRVHRPAVFRTNRRAWSNYSWRDQWAMMSEHDNWKFGKPQQRVYRGTLWTPPWWSIALLAWSSTPIREKCQLVAGALCIAGLVTLVWWRW